MAHLLILGKGWVGSAITKATEGRIEATSIDPPLDPRFAGRDPSAAAALMDVIESHGVTQLINACGRVTGTDDELNDANLLFPQWLCETIRHSGVRLVHIGSASEYGDPHSDSPVDETTAVNPVGAYAESKAAGTEAVVESRANGLQATVARVFNLVSSPIPAVSPIHQWQHDLSAIAERDTGDDDGAAHKIDVWWPPTTRDFITLSDAATALIDLSEAEDLPPIVNVCSGVGLRFDGIVSAMADQMGLSVDIRSLNRPGIETVIGDPSLLGTTIGWVPKMDLDRLASAVATSAR